MSLYLKNKKYKIPCNEENKAKVLTGQVSPPLYTNNLLFKKFIN